MHIHFKCGTVSCQTHVGHAFQAHGSDKILLLSMYFIEFVTCVDVMSYRVCIGVFASVQHSWQDLKPRSFTRAL